MKKLRTWIAASLVVVLAVAAAADTPAAGSQDAPANCGIATTYGGSASVNGNTLTLDKDAGGTRYAPETLARASDAYGVYYWREIEMGDPNYIMFSVFQEYPTVEYLFYPAVTTWVFDWESMSYVEILVSPPRVEEWEVTNAGAFLFIDAWYVN